MQTQQYPEKYAIYFLLFGAAYIKMAAYMSLPFLAIYLIKYTHLTPIATGAIISASPLAALVGGFMGGQLSDRFSRQSAILFSLFGSFLSYLAFYWLLDMASEMGFILLIIASAMQGFFTSLFSPSSQVLLGDITPEAEKNRLFQLRYAMTNIGAAIGPILGVLLGLTNSKNGFLASSVLYLLYFFIIYFIVWRTPVFSGIGQLKQDFLNH